jgi:acyl-CoA synthetase (AMP-forming)/AMP-acid ligase II
MPRLAPLGQRTPSGNAWTALIGTGLALKLSKRVRLLSDLEHWSKNAQSIQTRQLRTLLTLAQRTEVGREARFAKLIERDDQALLRDYRKALPLADYEQYRAQLARTRENAEPDVCWPGVVMDWAQTSGTTGGEKYIPVSKQMMRSNYIAALDIFAHSIRRGLPLKQLFGGKMLFLGGTTQVTTNEHGIRTGDLSGLVTPLIKWPLSQVYTPGKEIALLSDWPTKIQKIAELCIDQDVRFVSGMSSWSLLLFEQLVEMAQSRSGGKATTLRDIWPNFQMFIHGGTRYPPFDPRVRTAWSGNPNDDVPYRLEVYPASEGFIAVQDQPNRDGQPAPLRLHTDVGIFYEFVAIEDIDDPDARSFTVGEVETGQRYVVVMSTCAGLWRYIIGDVVVFDSAPGPKGTGGLPRLRIVGRHKHFINAFGENLIVEQIENAVVAARDAVGIEVGEFTASPVYPTESTRGGLELVVEFADPQAPTEAFRKRFDDALKAQNVDYTTKRGESFGMTDPRVTPVPIGLFSDWMQSRGKLGGQNKVPRCANHRDFVNGLREMAGLKSE